MDLDVYKNRDRAIRPSELQQIFGVSRSTVHRMEIAGVLPKKRKFPGGTSCYYLESEITEFLRNQPQADTQADNDSKK